MNILTQVILFAIVLMLLLNVPSVLGYVLEKITGKEIRPTAFNTQIDLSEGRAQAITIYKANSYEGGDRI